MTLSRGVAACGLLVVMAFPSPAEAQGCSGAQCTVEVRLPVTDVLRLSFSASSIALGTPAEADYTAGFRDAASVLQVSAKANRAFVVQVGGVVSTFSYAGSLPNPMKPASDLRWATSSTALSSTPNHMGTITTLVSQGPGSVTTPIYLRTLWSFTTDVPGVYSLALSFTISAP